MEENDLEARMDFMGEALAEAYEGIRGGHGGPFGSVVVLGGRVVGRGHNRVLEKHDPTCHGEMEAIRDACRALGTHDLSGAELYTTAAPCPMCLGGILWANIRRVHYGCTVADTAAIGFRDDAFYRFLAGADGGGQDGALVLEEEGRAQCRELFREYTESGAVRY